MPHHEDPDVMSQDDRASGNQIGTQDTAVPDSLAERMAITNITDSSPASRRPEVSRFDTDSYPDYPSTEPAASSAAKVAEPSGHDELETSPYADEHALNRRASSSSSETSGVPLASNTQDSSSPALPRYTDKTSHSPTHSDDPAFLVSSSSSSSSGVHEAATEHHAFLDSTPQSAPAAVHPVADPLDKERAAAAATHEARKTGGGGILGKVASMLGSGKATGEKEERVQGKKGIEEGEEEVLEW